MEKVLANALNSNEFKKTDSSKYTVHINDIKYSIKISKSGPAHTLEVTFDTDDKFFAIDFVLAIPFSKAKAIVEIPGNLGQRKKWLAIPKPRKNRAKGENNRAWICSYIQFENILLQNQNKGKPLIRIFKVGDIFHCE